MKRLFKRRGVPFVLTLGVLSFLSGGFLFYQVVGGPNLAGSAAALETPSLPPPLEPSPEYSAPPAGLPPSSGHLAEPLKSDAATASPSNVELDPAPEEITQAPAAFSVVPVQPPEAPKTEGLAAPVTVAQVKAAPATAAQLKAAPAPVVPVTVAQAKAAPVTAAPVASTEKKTPVQIRVKPVSSGTAKLAVAPKNILHSPTENMQKVVAVTEKASAHEASLAVPVSASPKKVRMARRKKAQAIPTEAPSEWNWFSSPLKVKIVGGRFQIRSDEHPVVIASIDGHKGDSNLENVEVKKTRAGGNPPKVVFGSGEVTVSRLNIHAFDLPGKMPFAKALEIMAKGKEKRARDSRKIQVVLPSSGGSLKRVPECLRKMQQVVVLLREGVTSFPELNQSASFDSLAPAAAAQSSFGCLPTYAQPSQTPFSMGLSEILREEFQRNP